MQRSGVTNPLLQQFGRGLGGLFNIEMRSPMEIAQAEQKTQQEQLKSSVGAIKDPSSYEGMVQMAQAVMKIDPIQGAQLLAAAEEKRKASQQTGLQQEATLTRINESVLPQERKNQLIKDYMSGISSAQDVMAALTPMSDEKRYKTVGNRIFDIQDKKYLSPEDEKNVKSTPLSFNEASKLMQDGFITAESFRTAVKNNDITLLDFKEPQEALDDADFDFMISEANNVIDNAKKAVGLAPESFTGATAQALGQMLGVPWSDAIAVEDFVTQIQANLAFDKLQRMRDASKTGGALGQVSNIELNLLKSSVTALNPKSKNFKDQLNTVINYYSKFIDTLEKGRKGVTEIPSGYEILGNIAYKVDIINGKKYYTNENGEVFQVPESE
jgi:hypothetical protein